MSQVSRFSVSMDDQLLERFDQHVQSARYASRSEALRDIVRDYLVEGEWQANDKEVIGTITLVYDHHQRELDHTLIDLQHRYHTSIICSTHVHLDHDNCLEVIVVRGDSEAVRSIADQLISARGVKHGKLVCTTTGAGLG